MNNALKRVPTLSFEEMSFKWGFKFVVGLLKKTQIAGGERWLGLRQETGGKKEGNRRNEERERKRELLPERLRPTRATAAGTE
ncbi:Uncharacterized protein TCM_035169 [Theobroma cacao]|uniref:Uncharacterized protein n=1 Tax=Theobroma cacao TaxID=3641 RepID=A0A061FPB4_THECC|nr:Uncharacterized protein TCM_035169 [Theobroma cacao]